MRVREQLLQGEPVGVGAEALAVRAEAQHQVEAPLRAVPARQPGGEVFGVVAVHGRRGVGDGLGEDASDDCLVDGGGVRRGRALAAEQEPRHDLALGQLALPGSMTARV